MFEGGWIPYLIICIILYINLMQKKCDWYALATGSSGIRENTV